MLARLWRQPPSRTLRKPSFRIGIGMGMLQRIADAGLRARWTTTGKAMIGEQLPDCRADRQVELSKAETGMAFRVAGGASFSLGSLIVVDVSSPTDLAAG